MDLWVVAPRRFGKKVVVGTDTSTQNDMMSLSGLSGAELAALGKAAPAAQSTNEAEQIMVTVERHEDQPPTA